MTLYRPIPLNDRWAIVTVCGTFDTQAEALECCAALEALARQAEPICELDVAVGLLGLCGVVKEESEVAR